MSVELPMVDSGLAGPTAQAAQPNWLGWSDWAGMVASIGCAIHCAAMPFVIAYLPALGLSFLADEAFHKWMAVGCFLIALSAFVPGFRKHGRLIPVGIGSLGLVMISVVAFGFAGECCVACEAAAGPLASQTAGLSEDAAPAVAAEPCTDACCAHCASEAAATDSQPAVAGLGLPALPTESTASSQLVERIVPWMTPLGGIVLVFAHLLNRRYGCLCGCCEREGAEVAA
ncbi:MerC domain-containing protein [Roseimaritima ulvae]|uniref:MerC mercury resistance protein n=1 Tax=Roseimaritima ulvae TaxID=980254 RepID=A0A5B9QJT3_9BACT|nr:MerC domain-containing protein [Roseimaritima ulvae]QEG39318.1 MerC mercury resistance protein [Roseimaritima ulvae]